MQMISSIIFLALSVLNAQSFLSGSKPNQVNIKKFGYKWTMNDKVLTDKTIGKSDFFVINFMKYISYAEVLDFSERKSVNKFVKVELNPFKVIVLET